MRQLKMDPASIKRREYYYNYMSNPKNVERTRQRQREFRKNHPDKCREYSKRHYENNPRVLESTNKWASDNPKKVNAQSWARRKAPLKDHCEFCGAKKTDGVKLERHHPSYDNEKRADVLTLCRPCHRRLHFLKPPMVQCVGGKTKEQNQ